MATHSSILAWRIPWTEGYSPRGRKELDTTEGLLFLSFTWFCSCELSSGKEPACQASLGFDPWVGKIPWRRALQPRPVFLPGESHGQRSLVGYSPEGHKELDTTEVT